MFNSTFIILQATVLKKLKIPSTRDYQRNRNQSGKVKYHIKMCMQHCQWRTATLPSSEYLAISRDMSVGMIGGNITGVLEQMSRMLLQYLRQSRMTKKDLPQCFNSTKVEKSGPRLRMPGRKWHRYCISTDAGKVRSVRTA